MSSSKRHDDPRRAVRLARSYLRFGTRSIAEARTYLHARDVPEALVDAAVADCTRSGLLDDRACATLWATRLADQGYAGAAIRERLLAKGLGTQVVARALQPLGGEGGDEPRARLVVRQHLARSTAVRRASSGRPDPQPRVRLRLARLLARRGFDSDLIDRVLAECVTPTAASCRATNYGNGS